MAARTKLSTLLAAMSFRPPFLRQRLLKVTEQILYILNTN